MTTEMSATPESGFTRDILVALLARAGAAGYVSKFRLDQVLPDNLGGDYEAARQEAARLEGEVARLPDLIRDAAVRGDDGEVARLAARREGLPLRIAALRTTATIGGLVDAMRRLPAALYARDAAVAKQEEAARALADAKAADAEARLRAVGEAAKI